MISLLRKMRKAEVIMAIFCVALVVAQVYFELTLPDYMKDLTVLINTQGEMAEVWKAGLKMLGCTLASASLTVIAGYLAARTASGFSYAVREDLFYHVIDLGQGEMNDFSIPSLITRTTNDITQIQMLVAMGLQMFVKAPIMAVWAVAKILGKSWELSLATAAVVVVILLVVIIIMVLVIPRFRKVQILTDRINRIARENLTGINVVHAFNAEKFQNDKFEVENVAMMKIQLFNQRTFSILMPLMMLCMNGLSLVIYWLGAALINNIAITSPADMMDRMTLFGDVVVFGTYATYVIMSFMMIVMIFMMVPAAQVSAERIRQVLKADASVKEGSETEASEKGTVEFRNVNFRYPKAADDELMDINFKVNKGETLAIIGATGSGKTTLVGLMARFYDATAGEILIDGKNIKDYSFDALYNRVSYVTQKAVLFSGSIRENIDFGESENPLTEENIYDAIEIAQAKEFVDKLPDRADNYIAQAGKNVSGGQKQRLSIARALARKAEIIIFDDSFSALDYKTDSNLRKALSEKLSDTTKVIVAQRISTIRHADKILVLDGGKIVGAGTHEELMKNCDVYKEIAGSQLSAEELA